MGVLGAFNTIGSIIGTFVPTFVTIPAVGTSITFLIFSGILLVLAIIYFVSTKGGKKACIIGSILFVLCSIFGNSDSFAFWEKDLTYEGESIYNYLQVKETESSVILSTNVLFGVQSILVKNQNLTGMYYDYAMAAPVMAGVGEDDSADMLILGMGTGTYAKQSTKYFKGVDVEGVEIDEKITDLASEYFELPDTIEVTTYDGRAYLDAVDKKYDIIMVDAYQDITIPFQMSSVEFFTMVKEHLNEDGVMVVNMNMHSEEEGNINDYLADTIASVFSEVYTVEVPGATNRELFASNNPKMMADFQTGVYDIEDEELASLMNNISANAVMYEKGDYILTDDKAPLELLGMEVIDSLIQDELGYYKDIYEKDGIKGILNGI